MWGVPPTPGLTAYLRGLSLISLSTKDFQTLTFNTGTFCSNKADSYLPGVAGTGLLGCLEKALGPLTEQSV